MTSRAPCSETAGAEGISSAGEAFGYPRVSVGHCWSQSWDQDQDQDQGLGWGRDAAGEVLTHRADPESQHPLEFLTVP